MALLDVLMVPNMILEQKCDAVLAFDGDLNVFVDDMFETMQANNGLGLAAPQVGILQRLFVCGVTDDKKEKKLVCINPRLRYEGDEVESEEGCLSIPGLIAVVPRYDKVIMDAYDQDGQPYTVEADGLLAIVLQHEFDHLNGKLITHDAIKVSSIKDKE